MSLLSLITKDQPVRTLLKDSNGASDILLIDATTKLTPEYSAEVTDLPVEDGPDISDHVRITPVKLSVQGVISETPINLDYSNLATATGALLGTKIGGFGPTAGVLAGSALAASILKSKTDNPATMARKALENILMKKVMFQLVDKYSTYENLLMTSLSFDSDPSQGRKLSFSFSAKTIVIVKAQEVQITRIHKPVAHSAAKSKKLGTQTPTEDLNKKSNGSLLFQGLKGLGANLKSTGFM